MTHQRHQNIRLIIMPSRKPVNAELKEFYGRSLLDAKWVGGRSGQQNNFKSLSSVSFANYTTIIDENTDWSDDHISSLLDVLSKNEYVKFAFATRVSELSDGFIWAPNYEGDKKLRVSERRFIDVDSDVLKARFGIGGSISLLDDLCWIADTSSLIRILNTNSWEMHGLDKLLCGRKEVAFSSFATVFSRSSLTSDQIKICFT